MTYELPSEELGLVLFRTPESMQVRLRLASGSDGSDHDPNHAWFRLTVPLRPSPC
jgi:hypothetical protein